MQLKIAFLNLLADGLIGDDSAGEFMCKSPKNLGWNIRGPKIIDLINKLFAAGYDIVSVVENDHFLNILEGLQVDGRTINGVMQRVRNPEKNNNNAFTQHMARSYPFNADKTARVQKANPTVTFASDIKNEVDRAEFLQMMNSDKPASPALIPDFVETDTYVADYGNSVYVNDATVKSDLEGNSTRKYRYLISSGDTGFIQKFSKDGIEFNVLTAHLPSGEGPDEEGERVAKLTPLLVKMKTLANPIVVMDSNSSVHYRVGIERTITNVIQENGFKNIIPDKGNECYKQRSGRGEQERKYGELFVDNLDVMLIFETMEATAQSMESIVEFYPEKYREIMRELRTNKEYRQRLTNVVVNCDNKYDANGKYIETSEPVEIRSTGSKCIPIKNKSKTKTLRMMSANKKSRWGEEVTKNVYTGMADYIGLKNISDEQLSEMFAGLYPNDTMPSDHPPIGAIITIQTPSLRSRIYNAVKYYLNL